MHAQNIHGRVSSEKTAPAAASSQTERGLYVLKYRYIYTHIYIYICIFSYVLVKVLSSEGINACVRPCASGAALFFKDFLLVKVEFQKITLAKNGTLAPALS